MVKVLFEVRALRIKDADDFNSSYEYRKVAYVDYDNMRVLKDVRVPELDYWPACHMEGWPVFEMFLVTEHDNPEYLAKNNLEYLCGWRRLNDNTGFIDNESPTWLNSVERDDTAAYGNEDEGAK
jgi:hypothetical protein